MTRALVVQFAKAPELGKVKTRMQPALSAEASLGLHRKLVEHAFNNLSDNPDWHYQIWITGEPDYFEQLVRASRRVTSPVEIHLQQGDCLGQRMAYTVEQNLGQFDQVIIIGSDCPGIDGDYISRALSELNSGFPVVLGPAVDGGYGLIGFSSFDESIFQQVSWGTDTVLSQTRERLENLDWHWAELEPLVDIDRPQDLNYLSSFGELAMFSSEQLCN